MKTHNIQQILDIDEEGHPRAFDNAPSFSAINQAHIKSSVEMLLKGYIPIEREISREGDKVEAINGERLNRYCGEFRTKNIPKANGIAFYYTTSAIKYKKPFSDKTAKKIFIERTPWVMAWGAHGKTTLLDVITEGN